MSACSLFVVDPQAALIIMGGELALVAVLMIALAVAVARRY